MKFGLTYLIAWIGYYLKIDALFYFLNRRCKRVITFHNVFPDGVCKKDNAGGMSESESSFRATIRELSARFKFSNDFNDPTTATITFDDGFLNQYEVAAKVLDNLHIPAVLFVAGANIDRTDPMKAPSVDLLTVWLANAPDGTECLGERLTATNRLRFWIDRLRPAYAADGERFGRSVVEMCDRVYPFAKVFASLSPDYLRLRLSGISHAQLDDLRARGWKIGWHSRSHYALASVPEGLKRDEIVAPEEFRSVPMSYPYGEMMSVSERDIEIASEAGYPSAYSNLPEINPRVGRYFLPRFAVEPDKILLHFHLSGFRHFVKFRRLLPGANEREGGRCRRGRVEVEMCRTKTMRRKGAGVEKRCTEA